MNDEASIELAGPSRPAIGGDPSDSSLLRDFQAGDQQAATRLYLRYVDRLRTFAYRQSGADLAPRFDADDIVQSVFCSFFKGVSEGYYQVPPGSDLSKLLVVLALNKIRNRASFHRAAKRNVAITRGSDWLSASEEALYSNNQAFLFLKLVIAEILDTLPKLKRTVATLRIEGYEVDEIACKTGRSKRTVERILQDVRRSLAQLLFDPGCHAE